MGVDQARRVAYNSGLLICGRAFQIAVSVILLAFVARYLGQQGFGNYGYVVALVELFAVVVHMGLPRIVVRGVARDREQTVSYFVNAGLLTLALAGALFLALSLIGCLVVPDRELLMSVLIYFISQVFFYMGEIYFAVFRAYERMEYQALAVIISRSIMLGLVLLAVYQDLGFAVIFAMILLANVANLAFAHYFLVSRFVPSIHGPDLGFLRQLAISAFPVGVSLILRTYFWQSSVVLLVAFRGQVEAGALYGPLRLMEHSTVLPFAFVASMLPVLSRLATSSASRLASSFDKAFKLSLIVGALCAMAFTSLSGYIVPVLLGPEFSESVQALQLLGWVPILLFPNIFLGMSLVAVDKQVLETMGLLVSLMASLGCNLILIPRYGLLGACCSILVAEGVFFVISSAWLLRQLASVFLARVTAKVWICSLVFALVVFGGRGHSDLLVLPLSFIIFAGSLFLLGVVDREELAALRSLVLGRSGG